MATYTQEAKRLVLVANAYTKLTTDIATGQVGFINANGANIASTDFQTTHPEKVKLFLKTDLEQYGFVNPLNLLSETITKDMIMNVSHKAFEQPKVMTHSIILDTRTYSAGEEVILSIEFDSYGSVSNKNIYSRYGAYYVPANSTAQTTVATQIVANLNKNLKRDMTPRVKAYAGSAGFIAAVGANLTVTHGSKTVTGSVASSADYTGIAIIRGVPYHVVVTNTSTTITLDRPYEGATETAAKATVAADSSTSGIYLIGEHQVKIDFHNMFIPITWKSTITVDGEAVPTSAKTQTAATKGSGYGPEVALIEEFANNSTNRQQYVELRKQYDARLQAVASKNYDVVNIKLGSTKVGSGSNVTSIREIQVYVDAGQGTVAQKALQLSTDLKAWA
jgi:hypothetical protein